MPKRDQRMTQTSANNVRAAGRLEVLEMADSKGAQFFVIRAVGTEGRFAFVNSRLGVMSYPTAAAARAAIRRLNKTATIEVLGLLDERAAPPKR